MAETKATSQPNVRSKRAKVMQDQAAPVTEPTAPVFVRKLRKAAVGTGCDIRLRVSVAGCPKPALAWYHNDEPLPPSEAQDSGGLWIRDCHMCDAGLYTCVATNNLGEARTSALLAIMDLGDDSETTEDEATESQVPMETKEGAGRHHQDKAGRRAPAGEGGRTTDVNPGGGFDRRATLPGGGSSGGYDPVIERELMALGSRPPGSSYPDPNNPSSLAIRIQTADESKTPSSPSSVPAPSPSHHHTSPSAHNNNGIHTQTPGPSPLPGAGGTSGAKSKVSDARLDQSPASSLSDKSGASMTPKLARAAPKIFDKVVAFEERRSSLELPGGGGGNSRARIGRASSCDSADDGRRRDDDGRVLQDAAAQRRSSFKQQRASSLEDKVTHAQRSFQSKFTEELQRIKRLVGRPAMKKAHSTEQVNRTDSPSAGRKLEPIPQQVVKKLEARERALEAEEEEKRERRGEGAPSRLQARLNTPEGQRNGHPPETMPRSDLPLEKAAEESSSPPHPSSGKASVTMETAPVRQLPRQPLPTVARRRSPTREISQSSSAAKPSSAPMTAKDPPPVAAASSPKPPSPSHDHREKTQLRPHPERDPSSTEDAGGDRSRSPSPMPKRTSPPAGSRDPSKPPRLSPSPTPPISPLQKRRRGAEAGRSSSPALKLTIPTIVVEDESAEAAEEEEAGNEESRREEGRKRKGKKKGRSGQPRSPEEGGSSDDSYMSADEGPEEGPPQFKRPLEDTTARAGSEVTLTCTVTGSPPPTVSWHKGNVEIRSDALRDVRSQGKTHSLAIRQLRPGDAGTYRVTAVSAAGNASCSATLYIQSEPSGARCGKPALSPEVVSPIQSDEEYLSPQEDAMEVGEAPAAVKHVHFRDPPSFQVALGDQSVTEGHEVVFCAKVLGHPKPVVYWSKERAAVRSGGRFIVRETDDDTSEMRIASAQRADAGVYVCKLINEYGTKQSECRLEVRAVPVATKLTITRNVRDVAVKAGETAMFECHMTGPPDVEVDWLSNGKLVQPALLNCKMHFDGKRCRLLLNSVHEDDSGKYTCKLSTAKEELTSSAGLKVTPSKEPLFTRKLDILEVIEGRTARFNCKVSGSPPLSVTWMHFETPVEESDDVRILREGGRYSLVIGHVSSDTEGFYTAVAQNFHGKAESTAELYMQEPRAAISSHMAKLEKMPSIPEEPEVLESEVEKRTMPDFVKPLADVEVIEGKEAVLKCKVTGLPYPTIAWYHNGKRIDSTEERKMTHHRDVHSLLIKSVCHAHGGVYKAVISNKVGKAACYAHLYITDIVPEPPDGPPVVEAITGKTITLSWKKPKRLDTSLDASSLLYAVQQQPLGSIQWTIVASSLKETHYTVTSLSKGVRYAFRVLASTGKTLSKPSHSTDLVQLLDRGPYLRKAPVILDKPDAVYVVESQPANITITLNHVHAVVTWKRRGVVLLNRPGMYEMSMPDDDQHNLKFQRVRATDVGQLVVTANNPLGSDLCTILVAMAEPPKFESIMEDLDVDVGDTSRFAVVVMGKPDPDILWYKDDVLLSESSHFTFVYDDPECSLVVLNASQEDSGVYTCTAKNQAGAVSCKAELTVHTERKQLVQPVEDEATILRKMRHLADYYDIHKEIGRGAFSYVKRVTQKKSKKEFAAKFVSARGKRKALALREMSLLSELDNERILYFHDAFEKKNMVVVITDLCHEELLERMARKTTVMESEIRSSVRQVLEGLSYLHQKDIAHLDIKPENILMASSGSDQIRICDFGNATKLEASEEQYCKYGTPEYVAPEIVNQNPVSKATDIWPVGVITYLCLTGVSPFAGENDRVTALNIRNANVAFEESMFSDLCKEARGFIIKLLVVDRLRPSAVECLRHPWFKSSANKSISTAMLKQVLSRRRWQRSLISYKSKMVLRTIPELLNDSTNHISIAVARHLKEGSPPPSSSSDSDEDVDELPFIPMPLSMVFSGSRVSLNEIPGDEDAFGRSNGAIEGTREKGDREDAGGRGGTNKTMTEEEMSVDDEEKAATTKRVPLKKGASVESDEDSGTKARRATMRRGSSADSALLLHVDDAEEGDANKDSEASKNSLKKAVSMELPNRSPSPGGVKLSQEDYALKLELMRQRLLRGGSADKKMSGLRGPLFETLGMDDERNTGSLDRNLRRSRVGPPSLTRAASETADDTPKTKVFKKSASFSQGDSEPMPLHRRFGAPLEIPSASHQGSMEGTKLQEATSMSALTEQTTVESMPASPTDRHSFVLPSPGTADQRSEQSNNELEEMESSEENDAKRDEREMPLSTKDSSKMANKPESGTYYSRAPTIVIEDHDDEKQAEEKEEINTNQEVEKDQHSPKDAPTPSKPSSAYASVIQSIVMPPVKSDQNHSPTTPVTTTATLEKTKPGSATSLPKSGSTTSLPKSGSTTSLPKSDSATSLPKSGSATSLPKSGSATSLPEHPAVYAKVANSDRPGSVASTSSASERPTTPHQPVLRSDIKDIESEEVFEAKFKKRESSLTRGLRRLTGNKSEEKSPVLSRKAGEGGEEVYRPGPLGSPLEMVTRGLQEKSKSVQDLRQEEKESGLGRIGRFSLRTKRSSSVDKKAEKPKEEKVKEVKEDKPQKGSSEASPGKRRVTWAIGRSKSLDTKELDGAVAQGHSDEKEQRKMEESSVFAMRRKFESKVAGISAKIRTQSEERKEKEAKKSAEEGIDKDPEQREQKKVSDSPVLAMRQKFENKMAGISTKLRSQSEERTTETEAKSEGKRTPLFTRHRHSQSEGRGLKGMGIPENQLAKQTDAGASKESIESTTSTEKVSQAAEGDRRSRWDRWGLGRSKRDKTPSRTDPPSSVPKEDDAKASESQQFGRSSSDFPPVFHIKLRDHVLLEGDPVTLSCLPAGSPHPQISWLKDKKPLEVEARMNLISHPDGRQLLMIMRTSRLDAGLYECVAVNALGTINSSCTLSLACVPKRPGTPEIPQTYNNTALVLWKPADTKAPCTYALERRTEGDVTWLIVATGVVDCYYNVTDLPQGGTFRFRVACVNKAGQGPYSNMSPKVSLNPTVEGASSPPVAVVQTVPNPPVAVVQTVPNPPVAVVQTVPTPPVAVVQTVPTPPLVTSSMTIPPLKVKPVQTHVSTKSVTVVSWSSASSPKEPPAPSPAPPTATLPSSQTATTAPTPPSSASSTPATPAAAQDAHAGGSSNQVGLPSPPSVKPPPPLVLPKPQKPNINVVSPMTQSPPLSQPPPALLATPPSSPTKPAPAASAVPSSYSATPAATARVAPTQQVSAPTFTPHVLQMSSLSPLAEGMSTPTRGTPSRGTPSRGTPSGGRATTPSNALRQGVPQKPYTFLDERARGRFGVIRDCRENATGKVYMAKIVPYDQQSKAAILKEYEILKSLHNDKVMALHEAYVTPRYLVLVAEYCTGKELLYSLVDRFRYSEDDVVGYLVQILQGLEYLHNRRVLHLDLRPDNVMVTNLNVIKIVDFGSAQTFNPLSLKPYESSSGTLEYMAPEMLKGDLVGPPADVWTLGVVAFIMLSGRLPFQERDPQQTEAKIHMAKFEPTKLYPNVSQSASAFLKKMLSSYPWARPTTKDCFTHAWLQDSYLMKLRRQTLTFTTSRLKEFLVEQHSRRTDGATKHKVLLRTYQSSPQTQTSDTSPSHCPDPK